MSPEGLLENIYGAKTDVWAFGVFIYEIIHGDTPLAFCQNEVDLKMHIMNPIRAEAFHPSVSMDLRDLIRRCLEVNEHKRISIPEIEHTPFMRRIAMQLGAHQHPLELAAHTKSGQKIGVEGMQAKRMNSQQPHDSPYTQIPNGLQLPPMQRGIDSIQQPIVAREQNSQVVHVSASMLHWRSRPAARTNPFRTLLQILVITILSAV